MTDKLKVGIAGYGVVGKRRREVIDAHPALKTVAVSDRRLKGDGAFDDAMGKTVTAFQRHFRPARCDGRLDLSTLATLERLLDTTPAAIG